MKTLRNGLFLLVCLLVLLGTVEREAIVRGPYLQPGSPSSVIVRWRTHSPTLSVLHYGSSSEALTSVASHGTLYSREHEVEIKDLLPRTRYVYRISEDTESSSDGAPTFSFETPPAGGDEPFSVWALGDAGISARRLTGETETQMRVRDSFLARHPVGSFNFLLLLGDNAYSEGTDSQYQRGFFDPYKHVLPSVVTWSTQGNHDVASNAYYNVFSLPSQGEWGGISSGTERYYSFEYGNAHFVSLNSELAESSIRQGMIEWLERDLAANQKEWTIAVWHHPPYSKGSHDSDRLADSDGRLVWMRENVLPILERHGVDLVLSGHSHSYERSHLMHGHYGPSSTFSPQHVMDRGIGGAGGATSYVKSSSHGARGVGTVYVVAGSGGEAISGPLNHPAMVVSKATIGSLYISFDANEMTVSMEDGYDRTFDRFSIRKDPTRPRGVPDVSASVTESGCEVSVAWGKTDNAVSYSVYRSLSPLSRGAEVWTGEGARFIDTNVTPTTTYYYSVRASGSAGKGPWGESKKVVVTSASCATSDAQPHGL